MEWTNELALQLIDEYEKHPILWDAKHELHFSRNKKIDAWDSISNNLKVDVQNIKQKVNSLLGSFRREKAKGKKSIGTGKGRCEVYISKWFAFDRMGFLLDKDEPRTTLHTQVVAEESDETLNSQTNEDEETQTLESPIPFETVLPQPSRSSLRPKKKQKNNNNDLRLEEAYQIMKGSLQTASDNFTVYGQHISNKLRSYSKHTQIEVEHAINNILYHADVGFYDRSTPSTHPFTVNNDRIHNPSSGDDDFSPSASSTASYSVSTIPTPIPALQNSSNMLDIPDFADL